MTGDLDIEWARGILLMLVQLAQLIAQGLQHFLLAHQPEGIVRATGDERLDLLLPVVVSGGLLFGGRG
ncbi:hypothetical protein D3C78_1704610 [compost metagenome]